MKKIIYTIIVILNSYGALAQTAGFTYQSSNGLLCNPATIQFTQTSSGSPLAFFWNFGNGQTSNLANPSIVFTAGTYIVSLTAVYKSEAKTTQETITINPTVTATLNADKNYLCTAGTINFTATVSSGVSSFEWAFGDGSTTTTGSPNASHTYSTFGNYPASVKAIASTGCFANATYNITVQRPPISANVTPTNGCVPATANFSASANLPVGDNITSFAWDFGDGSPIVNTTTGSATHPYNLVGSYSPVVSITTGGGCSNSYSYQAIAYGTPPVGIVASSDKLIYCGSETPAFFANANSANSYLWDFGDGSTVTTSNNNIGHTYSILGVKNITVTPLFNGCAGTAASLQVTITGVITSFDYANSCSNKNTFNFTNNTQGNQSIIVWDFGDGSPPVSTVNPTHTFPTDGSFITTLTVTDNVTGCANISGATIFTQTPALVNTDLSICKYSNTQFTINNNYTNPIATYTWNVFNQPVVVNTSDLFSVSAPVLGNFNTNYVIINNGSAYCPDTINLDHGIVVRGPNLSYTMAFSQCLSDSQQILNTSAPFIASDAINLWYWNYNTSTANDTIFQPVPLYFSAPGVYNIKLVAIDINGCKDSLIKPLMVNPIPFLRIIPRDDTLCIGNAQQLIAFSNETVLWSPPQNLSCIACDTTLATPASSTLYHATAQNSFGCSVADSCFIRVVNDFNATAEVSPLFICSQDSVHINALPRDKVITWAPATNLLGNNKYNPIVFPKINTIYIATLVDSTGCFTKTAEVTVNIKTLPTVHAGPDKFYNYNSAFTIAPEYSANVATYNWEPARDLNCTNCPVVNGIATDKQTFYITVNSDSGCIAKDSINILVDCKGGNIYLPTAFTPDGNNLNDTYYPLSRGIKIIKKFIIFNRAGKIVFQASNFLPNNKTLGWDGTYNGSKQPVGGYVYVLEATCYANREVGMKGVFTLIR